MISMEVENGEREDIRGTKVVIEEMRVSGGRGAGEGRRRQFSWCKMNGLLFIIQLSCVYTLRT